MTSRSVTPPPGSLTADRPLRIAVVGPVPESILPHLRSLCETVEVPGWSVVPVHTDLLVTSGASLEGAAVPQELRGLPSIVLVEEATPPQEIVSILKEALWLTLPVSEREITIALRCQQRIAELQNALSREERQTIQSQRRLGMALKGARMGTWTRDLKTEKVEWSPELEEIYGLPHGSFPGTAKAFTELMHPDDRERVADAIAKAMRQKTDYEVEYRYLHASGEFRWMVGRGRGFYDRTGNLAELAGVGIDITDKKKAQERLDERESQLRQIGDNLPDGALYQVVGDVSGARAFIYWSAGLEKLTGVPVKEVLADPGTLYRLIHPDDVDQMVKAEQRSFRERCVFDTVIRLKHRITGEWRWVHLRSAPRTLSDGLTVWDGIYFDITARKQVEEALALSMERLDLAQRVGHIGVFDWDMQTGALVWNEEEHRIFGLEPGTFEECIEAWARRLVPEDAARVQEEMTAAMARREQEWSFHFRILHASGAMRWVEGAARVLYNAEGKPSRMVGINFDVTEREEFHTRLQQVNRELQHRVTELETITNVLPVGLAIARDPECRVIHANPSFKDLLGFSEGENVSPGGPNAAQLPFRILREGKEVAAEELPMQRAAATGKSVPSEEYEVVFTNGRSLHLLITAGPIIDEQGKPRGAVGAHTDITLTKEAERALRDADRRKNEFLAMLSHELRNPLAAIRNALEVCDPEDCNKETFQWARNVLLRQSSQLTRLVDDLLDVARITRGKIHLRKIQMDAASALERAVEAVRPLISERKQVFVTDFDTRGKLPVEADPARLEQIVVNLLTNANKYTEVGGRIWLEARRTSEAIVISVRDTGIGILPEKLPEMFEIFTQGERSIDRSEGGLGLGLTIVRNLAELHGGTVTAQSEGLGKGTEFTITLPAADQKRKTELPFAASTPALQHDGCRARVLVVDDNVDTAHGLSRLLGRRNYVVEVAFDGYAAMEAAEKFAPAIMLLDLGLPGMNGYELATRFRADTRFQHAALIAISGYGQDEDRVRSRAAGFDHHLTKPVDLSELETLLEQAVRRG